MLTEKEEQIERLVKFLIAIDCEAPVVTAGKIWRAGREQLKDNLDACNRPLSDAEKEKAVANKKKRAQKILEVIRPALANGATFMVDTDPRGWTYKIEVTKPEHHHPALENLHTDFSGYYILA